MKTPLGTRTKHLVFRRPSTIRQRRRAWLGFGFLLCLALIHAFPAKLKGASLIVTVPATAVENRGTMTNAGTILLSGTLPTNLVVSLQSSDPTIATVPATATVIAGQIGGAFSITIVDDLVVDGSQTNTVTVSAPGFVGGSDTIIVFDNESPPVPSNPLPANLATNIPADADLSWQSGAAGITNDIYFGTNATPGAGEFLGSTVSTNWTLPLLAPNTTYYWQVVARNIGITAGPVWRFTTRGADHFDFDPVPSPQVVNQPFPVTLTARDEFNRAVTNFTGTASLAGFSGPAATLLFGDNFEDGNISDWTVLAGNYTRAVTNSTAAGGARSVTLIGGQQNHYDGLSHALGNIQPARVQFHVRASANDRYGGYFVLGNGGNVSEAAVFFYMTSDGMMGISSTISHLVPYVAGQWYQVTLLIDWLEHQFAFLVDGSLVATNIPFRTDMSSLNTLHLYNFDLTQTWWDEIEFSSGALPRPITISPTNSGSFTNGVWSGNVTVHQPATNMFLQAAGISGQIDISTSFDVRLSNDLRVVVSNQPGLASVGGFLTNRITVDNSGPAGAVGVTVTNFLPPTVSLVSAIPSQGSCVLVSNRVECGLDSLAAGESATIVVVTVPSAAGLLTNLFAIGRSGPDGFEANNSAQSVTIVLTPSLSAEGISVVEGSNGLTAAVFNLRLWPPSPTNVTVTFATLNGSASAGTDYLGTNGVLSFSPGQTNHAITVFVVGDTAGEPHEDFFMVFSEAVHAFLETTEAVAQILNDDLSPDVYLRSTVGLPFGSAANETAMDRAFGLGNWQDLRFETVLPAALFSDATRFIFMEGSDAGADEMEMFLATNRVAMETWVNTGGRLFLNAAASVGDGMDLGFGATLSNNVSSFGARASSFVHPIYWEPFNPVGYSWSGSAFGLATVSGGGLVPILFDADSSEVLLAEKKHGEGLVLFGGMTPDEFHFPHPEAANLRANILSYTATFTACSNCPPVMLAHPTNLTVVSSESAFFTGPAKGTEPLFYQWRHDGTNIPGATNATYIIASVETNHAGIYHVIVTNAFGLVASSNAVLNVLEVPPSAEFRIVQLLTTRSAVVDHNNLTGDDRGGIAVSTNRVFYSGDSSTARFALTNLSGGTALGRVFDALVSDLRSGQVYSLGNGPTPVTPNGIATTLLEHDGNSGLLNGVSIPLSRSINLSGGSPGIFAGYGRFVLHTGTRVYDIHLPSGIVADKGPMGFLDHQGTENWAYWGVAEYASGTLSLVYVRNPTTIVRTAVPSGFTTTVGNFSNLSDMAAFTVSVPLGRWYFHYEGSAQFGGSAETIGYADAVFDICTNCPPSISTHPANRNTIVGGSATFTVAVRGTGPLFFQWRKDGTNLVGATNIFYSIPNAQTNDAGVYHLLVTNMFGSATSSNAVLNLVEVPPSVDFQIVQLLTSRSAVVDHNNLTGDDRGGIAVSTNRVLYTGDNSTARFALSNLSGGTALNQVFDALVSDLKSGKIYSLGNGSNPLTSVGGIATTLLEHDSNSGLLNGVTIPLSDPINLGGGGVGIFAGYGRVVLHSGTRVYDIILPAGIVVDKGAMGFFSHQGTENWAYWGVAEYVAGTISLVYVRDSSTIVRTSVPSGVTTTVGNFSYLSDMAAFTVSVPLGRWYFHYEGSAQFGGSAETIGYADALFNVSGSTNPPFISEHPFSRTVASGRNATFAAIAFGALPLHYQWHKDGVALLQATNSSLTISNVQASDNGLYSVRVTNLYGSAVSSNATLTVVTNAVGRVAVLSSTQPVWSLDVRDKVEGVGYFSLVDLIMISDGFVVPTLEDLKAYSSVMVFSDSPFNDALALGNVLADYVDLGGGVVFATFAFQNLDGRIVTGDYLPLTQAGQSQGLPLTLVPDLPLHPLLAGVNSFHGGNSSFHHLSAITPGSTLVAHWNNGRPLVATKTQGGGNVVALNFFPPSSDARNDFWDATTDGALLMANALRWGSQLTGSNAPVIWSQPSDRTTIEGDSASFSVSAFGTAPLAYQWRKDGINLPNATNASYTIASCQTSDAGVYSVVITNLYGSVTSSNASLILVPTDSVVGVFDHPLYVDTTNPGIDSESDNVQASIQTLGYFSVPFTNLVTAVALYDQIVIPDQEGRSLVGDLPPATLAALSNFVFTGGKLIVHATPSSLGRSAGLLNAVFGLSIAETTSTGPFLRRAAATGTAFGDDPFSLPANTNTISVVPGSLPAGSRNIYSNATGSPVIMMERGNGVVVYLGWDWHDAAPRGAQNGGWLTVLQSALLQDREAARPPLVIAHPQSQSVVAGTNATFNVLVSGSIPLRYQWRLEGTNLPNATNSSYTLTNIAVQHQGNYSVMITNSAGATLSSNAFLNVLTRPAIVLNPVPQTVAQGQNATFSVVVTGTEPLFYRWLRNGVTYLTNGGPTLIVTNAQANASFRVAVSNYLGSVTSLSASLTVLPDADRDGLPDAWELQYGFNTNDVNDALLDSDGDGMSNQGEYIARTIPTNATSVLKIFLGETNQAVLRFVAQSNLAYTVQYRTNATSSTWTNIMTIGAQALVRTVEVTVPHPPAEAERFYRIATPPPP